jgi:hypothetical protein
VLTSLEIQIEVAKAEAERRTYIRKAPRWVTDPETGERVHKDVPVRVRKWWWKDCNGTLYVQVFYANRPVEIKKGKTSIVLNNPADLVPTLEKIRDAVKAGELDQVLKTSRRSIQRPIARKTVPQG